MRCASFWESPCWEQTKRMLSSTFNFKRPSAETGILLLLAALAVGSGALELVTKYGFSRISKIQRRIENEYADSVKIRPIENGRPSVLLCGNSLLLEGVDFPLLQR